MGNSKSKMYILRRASLWVTLAVIVLLIVLSVKGSTIKDPDEVREFFNTTPLVVFWVGLTGLLIAGLVFFPRLLRKPGLLAIHLGSILILLGAMWSSEKGHLLQAKLSRVAPKYFKDKIRRGYMYIYEGDKDNRIRNNTLKEVKGNLPYYVQNDDYRVDYRWDPGILRIMYNPTFTQTPSPHDQHQSPVAGDSSRTNSNQVHFDTNMNITWQVPAVVGKEHQFPEYPDPKSEKITKVKVLRVFRDFSIVGRRKYKDRSQEQNNPALMVEFEWTDGTTQSSPVFTPGSPHLTAWAGYEFVYVPGDITGIKDYFSELVVLDLQNHVQRREVIEMNKPLHYGGYHLYQLEGGRDIIRTARGHEEQWYTVLSVTSDSGVSVAFLGYWFLCLGITWQCWLRHIIPYIKNRSQNGN